MKQTYFEFPFKRLEELKEEEQILSKSIETEKRELEILERKHFIVSARIEEIERLRAYIKHDDKATREAFDKSGIDTSKGYPIPNDMVGPAKIMYETYMEMNGFNPENGRKK